MMPYKFGGKSLTFFGPPEYNELDKNFYAQGVQQIINPKLH